MVSCNRLAHSSAHLSLEMQGWPLREPVHIMSPRPCDFMDGHFLPSYLRSAAKFRREVQDVGSRVVFVPYYNFRDVVRKGESESRLRDYPARIACLDWLDRISPGVGAQKDGLYAKDFWMNYGQGDWGSQIATAARKLMRRLKWIDGRVQPLVRW